MTILWRSFVIWSSLMSSVIGAQICTCEWEPNSSLWRRAKARNVSLFTLYGGLFTFSTQLLTLIYLSRKATGSTWGNQFKDHRIAKLNKCKFLNFCNILTDSIIKRLIKCLWFGGFLEGTDIMSFHFDLHRPKKGKRKERVFERSILRSMENTSRKESHDS